MGSKDNFFSELKIKYGNACPLCGEGIESEPGPNNTTDKETGQLVHKGCVRDTTMKEPNLECWIMVKDGRVGVGNNVEFGVDIINGVSYSQVAAMENDIRDSMIEMVGDCVFADNILLVEFVAFNFSYQEGQRSQPERYDFPPHWDMDLKITKIVENKNELRKQ